jgi:deoxyribonuclease-4
MDELSHRATPVYDEADEYRPGPEPEPQAPAWCDGSARIGIHTSIAWELAGALESARKLGCNALQIFSGSPRMWPRAGSRINDSDAASFRARRAELGLGPLVIHANYLINLGSPEPMMRVRSVQAFNNELIRAVALGADFLVVHPGSGRGIELAEAIRTVAQSLRQAARGIHFDGRRGNGTVHREFRFENLARGGLRVLVENTSGMGSAIGSRFEELREILDQAPELPLGVCLDTAHAFEAGYAIHTRTGLEETVAALDRTVGLDRVAVLHVNDSKTAFGSRVDRHEHIGRGKIGQEALQRLLTHPRLTAAPPGGLPGRGFILETPIDEPGDDRRNVRLLWALAGVDAKHAPQPVKGFSMLRGGSRESGESAGAKSATAKRKRAPRKQDKIRTAKSTIKRA